MTLSFDDEAVNALVALSVRNDKTIRAICEDLFRDFQHGLKLVSNNTGRTSFIITRTAIEEPDRELSSWIVESFKTKTSKPTDAPESSGDSSAAAKNQP